MYLSRVSQQRHELSECSRICINSQRKDICSNNSLIFVEPTCYTLAHVVQQLGRKVATFSRFNYLFTTISSHYFIMVTSITQNAKLHGPRRGRSGEREPEPRLQASQIPGSPGVPYPCWSIGLTPPTGAWNRDNSTPPTAGQLQGCHEPNTIFCWTDLIVGLRCSFIFQSYKNLKHQRPKKLKLDF